MVTDINNQKEIKMPEKLQLRNNERMSNPMANIDHEDRALRKRFGFDTLLNSVKQTNSDGLDDIIFDAINQLPE